MFTIICKKCNNFCSILGQTLYYLGKPQKNNWLELKLQVPPVRRAHAQQGHQLLGLWQTLSSDWKARPVRTNAVTNCACAYRAKPNPKHTAVLMNWLQTKQCKTWGKVNNIQQKLQILKFRRYWYYFGIPLGDFNYRKQIIVKSGDEQETTC